MCYKGDTTLLLCLSIKINIIYLLLNSIQSEKDPQAIIFVKDVANAYIIGPKQSREDTIRKR